MTGHFAFRAWLNDGYWGIGNGTEREVAYDVEDPEDPARKRYRYALIQPFGQVAVRHEIAGPLSVFGSVNLRYSIVQASEGSLLAEQAPHGMDGGWGIQLAGDVILAEPCAVDLSPHVAENNRSMPTREKMRFKDRYSPSGRHWA